jgi:HEAT repeat protein
VVPLSRQDVDRLTDTAAPIERRLAEIDALAERGDEASARRLMALADHDPRLGAVAVAALGRIRSAEAETYLRARLAHPDPQVLAAAVRSLGRVAGPAAVAAIGQTLQQNHRREDGYEDTVCGACVEALGAVGSAAAVPMLAAELERTVGRDLQHEYGSQVVAALGRIGDASARVALLAYADRLRAQRDRQRENPLGRQYLDQKISAVAAAVDSLK